VPAAVLAVQELVLLEDRSALEELQAGTGEPGALGERQSSQQAAAHIQRQTAAKREASLRTL